MYVVGEFGDGYYLHDPALKSNLPQELAQKKTLTLLEAGDARAAGRKRKEKKRERGGKKKSE